MSLQIIIECFARRSTQLSSREGLQDRVPYYLPTNFQSFLKISGLILLR